MVLMIPLNALVYRNIRTYQMEQMKNKDRRNKMMDEILNGMKIIKLYAWESSFLRKVNDIRDQEIYALKVRNYYNSILEFQAFLYSLSWQGSFANQWDVKLGTIYEKNGKIRQLASLKDYWYQCISNSKDQILIMNPALIFFMWWKRTASFYTFLVLFSICLWKLI